MNCIIIDDEKLSCKVLEEFVKKTKGLELKGVYYNPIDAINESENFNEIDLLIMDIEMPEMSGLDVLASISKLPQVIIVSSDNKYAVDAFDFSVNDFLLKPIKYPRFLKAIQKIIQQPQTVIEFQNKDTNTGDGFFIKKNNTFVRVKYDEIVCIESIENYVAFQTLDARYVVHQTLKSVEGMLPQIFWRVHRSYIVNINAVKVIEDNCVVVQMSSENLRIPIGKNYKDKILNFIKPLK
ncbi:MAG: response regulator transcription factor [Bacteroidales bacterium]|nr:response regulator transcription factor [Bacteroidales bacterium]